MKTKKMRAIVWVLIAAMITTLYMPLNSYATAGGSLGTAVVGVEFNITTSFTLDARWGLGYFYKTADTSQRFQDSELNALDFNIRLNVSNPGLTNYIHSFTFTGTANTPITLYYILQDSADPSQLSVWTFSITGPGGGGNLQVSSNSSQSVEGEKVPEQPPCNHTYEWKTMKEATAEEDGEEALVCTQCGAVKEKLGLSAMGAFEEEGAQKILKAGPGATVNIDSTHWNTFGRTMKEAMLKRRDVTVKSSFLSEGHKGIPLKVTIPAGTDIESLYDSNGYMGLCRVGSELGYDQ